MQRARVGLILTGLAVLAGCGFKPRGAAELPFKTFYSSVPPASAFGAELRRAMRANGVTLTDRRRDAQARFDLLSELNEREITALSTSGRPREFQLRLRLRWQVKNAQDQDMIPANELVLRRQITVLDVQGVVNPEEEALLYSDMRQDAVRQIVRRLSAIKVPA